MRLIRSLLFYFWYVPSGVFAVLFVLTAGLILPLRWRLAFIGLWQYSVIAWLRVSCGVDYQIIGRENIPQSPYVVAANHQGQWEAYLFQSLFHPLVMVVKRELLGIPVWGWALFMLRPIAIKRENARESLRKLLRQGSERVSSNLSVLIFPEGTRMPPGVLGHFKRSSIALAAKANVPIVPVVHNSGDCWPAHRFLKSPGKITVVIGKPVIVGDNKSETMVALRQWAEAAYQAVREH